MLKVDLLTTWGGVGPHELIIPPANKNGGEALQINEFISGLNIPGWCHCRDCDEAHQASINEIMEEKAATRVATRIKKWLYDIYDYKLPAEQTDAFSALFVDSGKAKKAGGRSYKVHIARKAWWGKGSFYDGGSCFWSFNRKILEAANKLCTDFLSMTVMCEKEGGHGCTITKYAGMESPFDQTDKYLGLGRAWLVFDQDKPEHFAVSSMFGMSTRFWEMAVSVMVPSHETDGAVTDYAIKWNHDFYDNGSLKFYPRGAKIWKVITPFYKKGDEKDDEISDPE